MEVRLIWGSRILARRIIGNEIAESSFFIRFDNRFWANGLSFKRNWTILTSVLRVNVQFQDHVAILDIGVVFHESRFHFIV